MDTAIVRQFLDFFQDFLHLCQLENWPDNDTTEHEMKNAFLVAQHVEKCLNRLQRRDLINELLSTLNSNEDTSKLFLKNCLADPQKYILKKIINSTTKVQQMDVGFKVFLELFSEEKLETCLTEVMVEAASKETLLRNLSKEFPKKMMLDFKSQLLLSELNPYEDSRESLCGLLHSPNQDTIELLVVSLLNKDLKYHNAVNNIVNVFKQIMLSKNHTDKLFWKRLFKVEEEYFLKLCLEHGELFKILTSALLDSGKLLREQMSAEFFYIDLTYSELVFAVQKICKNDDLKMFFFDIVAENNSDIEFWQKMIS